MVVLPVQLVNSFLGDSRETPRDRGHYLRASRLLSVSHPLLHFTATTKNYTHVNFQVNSGAIN